MHDLAGTGFAVPALFMRASSTEKFIRYLLPPRHVVFGLLRREIAHAELAFLGLERRFERRNGRTRRDVIVLAEDLLALLRHDEIYQKLCGVRVRGILVDR